MFDSPTAGSTSSPRRSWSSWLRRNGTTSSNSTSSTGTSVSVDVGHTENASTTDQLLGSMCESMKTQIRSRAFIGWLSHTRNIKMVRNHLVKLVDPLPPNNASEKDLDKEEAHFKNGLTIQIWNELKNPTDDSICGSNSVKIYSMLYYGGCDPSIRKHVWPYLLNHYNWGMSDDDRVQRDKDVQQHYEITMAEWLATEAIVKQRDKEITAAHLAKLSSESSMSQEGPCPSTPGKNNNISMNSNDVFNDLEEEDEEGKKEDGKKSGKCKEPEGKRASRKHKKPARISRQKQLESTCSTVMVDESAISSGDETTENTEKMDQNEESEDCESGTLSSTRLSAKSPCPSPASSNGGVYSNELLDRFSNCLRQIEKDVMRCDRNYPFYAGRENLEKLRNIMCTYVWENLDNGYVQGMCDLVAPLLVIFQDEATTYSCFIDLMTRMSMNFSNGGLMDKHFTDFVSLIQVLDAEILPDAGSDVTHFYFTYRWFLLDFKREFNYDDVFRVWEAIWVSRFLTTSHFILFLAAALVEFYREVIISNNMDFMDIIKFYNEIATTHDANPLLKIARRLVYRLQLLSNHELEKDLSPNIHPHSDLGIREQWRKNLSGSNPSSSGSMRETF